MNTISASGAGLRNGANSLRQLAAWVGWATLLPLVVAGADTTTVLAAVPASTMHEPANLDRLKAEIRAYVDSGQYERDIAVVAARAQDWLEKRAPLAGGRLAIVFDLDETLLSNLPLMRRQDFGYVPAMWNAWVDEGVAPPINAVREIYRTARKLGVDVIFLSGRTEHDRASTKRNLRAIGCGEFDALILKADESMPISRFKLIQRRRLQREGRVIIANVGDQDSDFEGGESERNFKLPDPFYLIE